MPQALSVSGHVVIPVSPKTSTLSTDHIKLRRGGINGLRTQVTPSGEKTFDEHVRVLSDLSEPKKQNVIELAILVCRKEMRTEFGPVS